ncbi:MAG: carbohydrate ABC transporter permease [Oscillospiraceae bacterium]|nr:carbohydrate ABC transporter permease [Oscillospiraceae bacterium]
MSAIRRSAPERAFSVFNYVFMTILCVVCLYPIWHVLMASLSDPTLMYAHQGLLVWPIRPLNTLGYRLVMTNRLIGSSFVNTLVYLIAGTLLNMFITTMGAYGLSRKGLFWNGVLMKLIVFTMYFQGGLIPFYLMVKNMGLLNTRAGIILPVLVSTWNLIVMRTAFAGVSESLEESARLDGANDWTILWRIFFPLSQATVAVIALYYAVYWWNNWFNPSIFLQDRGKYPLQLLLREILIKNDTQSMTQSSMVSQEQTSQYRLLVKYCVIIVATAPILAVYPFLQKYFVKGVMIGSIKG